MHYIITHNNQDNQRKVHVRDFIKNISCVILRNSSIFILDVFVVSNRGPHNFCH